MNTHLSVRPAAASDVDAIHALLELYASSGIVLKRSKEDIAFFIGNFIVAEFQGKVCGCAALRDFGGDLLEVRSVVVDPARQGCGIGRAMVEFIIADVELNRPHFRLFTLTTTPMSSLAWRITSSMTSRMKRIRLSRPPPNSS